MAVIEASDSTFEREVLRSDLPVLVDLYADWCAPCKQLSPLVAQLADEFQGKLKVVKINIDKSPMLAQSLRVQSIPTLLLVHQGQLVDQLQGVADKPTLRKFVERVLPSDAAEVKPDELAQLIGARRALAVDIREPAAYARYRIPGAVSIPADTLMTRTADLKPTDGRVRVLYGRSTDDAKEFSEKLKGTGVVVGFLKGGFLHWEADGLEVERG